MVALCLKLNDELVCPTAAPNLKAKNANSACRKLGEKLRQPALEAIILHCGPKSAPVAPPNTLTDSYTLFLLKTQSYLSSKTRKPKSIPYNVILPKYTLTTLVEKVRYIITACFLILLSYTQLFYIAELYPILTQGCGIPYLDTLLSNSQFQTFAEFYPFVSHC